MKIPKSFALHGTTYSVVIVRPEEWEGEDKLYRNEKFVDTFAGLLHQALLTAE